MFKKLVLTVPIIALISSLSSASGKDQRDCMEESNRGSSALTSGETDRILVTEAQQLLPAGKCM